MQDDSKCPVTGKRKYMTEGEALSTASYQVETANAPKLKAYRCEWCDSWHLTKNSGPKTKRRR